MAAPTDYIAFFELDTDFSDTAGNYTATVQGDTNISSGWANFDGDGDLIDTNIADTLFDSSFTITLVMNGSFVDNMMGVFSNRSGGGPFCEFYYDDVNEALVPYFVDSNGDEWYDSAYSLGYTVNTDVTIQFVFDNHTSKVYKNGVLVIDHATGQTGTYSSGRTLVLGAADGPDYPFSGKQKKVRIYNRPLSDSEAMDVHNEDKPPATEVNGSGSGSVSVVATAGALAEDAHLQAAPVAATVAVTATSSAGLLVGDNEIFTFAYQIQHSNIQSSFKLIYAIEQPKTSVIIQRVNS